MVNLKIYGAETHQVWPSNLKAHDLMRAFILSSIVDISTNKVDSNAYSQSLIRSTAKRSFLVISAGRISLMSLGFVLTTRVATLLIVLS